MKSLLKIALVLVCLTHTLAMTAQVAEPDTVTVPLTTRRITPVVPDNNKVLPPAKDMDEDIIKQYLSGDTAKALAEARRDSLRKQYIHYPKLTDLTVGFNFADLVLAAVGQDYFNADFSCILNMWNRVQPVAELGIGHANSTPTDMNYTYKCAIAPYMRLGANYNFMFKNSPDYQALVGLRVGATTFKYDITDVNYYDSYWQERHTFDIKGESSNALWWEFVAGIKVKVMKRFSLGWYIKFHNIINCKETDNSRPWFIPGYGTRGSKLAFSFSVFYTLPLSKSKSTLTENTNE